MKNLFIKVVLIVQLIFKVYDVCGQQDSTNKLLEKIYQKNQQAKDYSVSATIKVDMPYIKMKPGLAKIYFKQKDKFKLESKSIIIVPRQGFDQLNTIYANLKSFMIVEQGTEIINGAKTTIVNLISLADTSNLILTKLWIDTKQLLVVKSQLTTKSYGTVLIEYQYGIWKDYGLPDFITFTVEVNKFKIPKVLGADINNSSEKKDQKAKERKKGKIYISLTNYAINKGIKDTLFKK